MSRSNLAGAPLLLTLLALIDPASAADQDVVSFRRDILPVLSNRCFKCHGPDEGTREAGLRLDQRDAATAALPGARRALVPGAASESELIERIGSGDPNLRMPPPEAGDALKPGEIEALRTWIDAGAEYEPHWAFVPPNRSVAPRVSRDDWQDGPIDPFILARLDSAGLTPAGEADRYTLIRRLSLDLIGLPPAWEEARAFATDVSPDAYEVLVERLLSSPQFGERWAAVWLDQARYADSKGYEKDAGRTIWPWRDWVIDALNADMPFDQFTIEQIAGDLLPDATPDQMLATAFHRNTMNNDEGGTDDEEFRVEAVKDRVNTTMQVWMGLTASCAQCHSHKFDPISHREYYQLFAFLNQTEDADRPNESPTMPILTGAARAEREALVQSMNTMRSELDAITERIDYADPGAEFEVDHNASRQEFIFVDDRAPVGSIEHQTNGPAPWRWETEDSAPVYSGSRSAWLTTGDAFGQFFATEFLAPVRVGEGARVLAHVWIDPQQPAREIMIQIHSARAQWGHRGYWGENLIGFGRDNSPERTRIGDLPEVGGWRRVEIDAQAIGLRSDDLITGIAFSQHGGRVAWDAAGIVTSAEQDTAYLRSQAAWETLAAERGLDQLPEDVRTALQTPRADRLGADAYTLRMHYLQHVHGESWRALLPLRTKIDAAAEDLAALDAGAPRVPIMRERPGDRARTTHILDKGNFLLPGDAVRPATLAALHDWPEDAPRDRLGLAQWLVSADNPLTARVFVNRIWGRLFGRGLVITEEDFGVQGMLPSHPDLLDSLALDFMDGGWRLKQLLRTIVMSNTYRQASTLTDEKLQIDPDNKLLSRASRMPLSAEMVRDQTLKVSGLLSAKMYGPPVYPPQPDGVWMAVYDAKPWSTSTGENRYRRALYTYWRRTSPYPALMNFDAPSREVCTPRRIRTSTPLQAFTTLNDPAFIEAAQALARRIAASGESIERRARFAIEQCLLRPAREQEIQRIVELVTEETANFGATPDEAMKMATDPLGSLPEGVDAAELAAWTIACNVIMNLDAFLTRQ